MDSDLLADLEGRDVVTQIADDLYNVFALGHAPSTQRYPGGQDEATADSERAPGGRPHGTAASGEQVYQGLRSVTTPNARSSRGPRRLGVAHALTSSCRLSGGRPNGLVRRDGRQCVRAGV
jgi:hypothetical protein